MRMDGAPGDARFSVQPGDPPSPLHALEPVPAVPASVVADLPLRVRHQDTGHGAGRRSPDQPLQHPIVPLIPRRLEPLPAPEEVEPLRHLGLTDQDADDALNVVRAERAKEVLHARLTGQGPGPVGGLIVTP